MNRIGRNGVPLPDRSHVTLPRGQPTLPPLPCLQVPLYVIPVRSDPPKSPTSVNRGREEQPPERSSPCRSPQEH